MKKLFYLLVLITGGTLLFTSCKEDDPDEEHKSLPVPENIRFTVSKDTAIFTWNEVSDAEGYVTEIKGTEKNATQEVPIATATFSDLEIDTEYSFRVKAKSSDGLSDSEFSEWIDFETAALSVLPAPANLTVSDITDSSATVSWDAVAGAAGYKVEHRKAGGDAEEISSSDVSISLPGLDAETRYEVRVMAAGDENVNDSEFSDWVEFTSEEGEIATGFHGGDGSESNPYLIATPGQLALLADKVNNEEEDYVTAHYKLVADIDLEGRQWTPIGIGTGSDISGIEGFRHDFIGIFDGDGHTVSNLYCVITADADPCISGLFGINRGNIRNLNVTGYSESNTTFSGTMGYSIAGGIVGVNTLSDDHKTGKIENCKFSGSVKATSSTDAYVVPAAGGICGVVMAGNIDGNEVFVGADDKIEAIGASADAGGVTGWFSAGGIKNCKAVIDGAVRSVIMSGSDTSFPLTANAGGLISGCGENMGYFSNCEVTVSATGSLYSESFSSSGTSNAGGIAATSRAFFSGMKVNIAGKIEAVCRDEGRVSYVGGILGQGTDIVMGNCEATITGRLSSVSDSSSGAAYIGGIMGNGTGTFSWNAVTLDGSYYVEAKSSVFCGGLYGGAGATGGCYFIMGSGGAIEMKSGTQYFGGITGNARLSNHHGCYAIIGGSIKANTSGNVTMGGICASIGGTTTSQRRNITGSYTIIDGSFTVEGQASPAIGGIVGSTTAYGSMNSAWWWCGNSTVTQGHGVNAGAGGVTQFAGKDKASLEAALGPINSALSDVSFAGRFVYDDAKQRLVIIQE